VTSPQTRETDGDYRPITINAPKGSILNPEYPAAIVGRSMIGHYCATLTSRVLSQVAPDMVMADPGMVMTSQINFEVPGEETYSELMFNAGGAGATAIKDGEPTLSLPTNLSSISLESMEAKTGNLRFHEKRLRQDSCGPGRHQGGLGQRIRLENTSDHVVKFNFIGRRAITPPRGIDGGGDGRVREVYVGGEQEPVKSEQKVGSGEIIEYLEAGGGGFGDPDDRERDRVIADVEAGYISPAFAEENYGVDAQGIDR
jgi:N-methylhydantoinase B